ncbi:hypothetical protein HF086_001189 [Spodoptera exigua]|uniref:Uncharacterized protein n=1 Tax=Spodoptera exigua TaxID=7107 RepID=A0A922MBQ5_SPOEX|nr:hypothetical protein HF086_001189 [Spodoptera exigua]
MPLWMQIYIWCSESNVVEAMKMEGGVLSVSSNNNRFRSHLKNAASALCARTLPKQRRAEPAAVTSARHHTYPRATPPKRAAISCRMEPLACAPPMHATTLDPPQPIQCEFIEDQTANTPNEIIKWKGTLAREVASAWECRVGPPDQPASADRVQSLFNDIELYPTKTQVFEMLVCARQCARRKSLTLTFGEFCVFAAELRRCSRQARQSSNKPESPQWNVDKELRDKDIICKHVNGSEATPPPCEVFLGGSCNPTTWRSDIAIPMLKKMGITYFNPIFRNEYVELSRARATLQEAVERRGLPAFTDIPAALRCARAVLRGARTHPRHSLGHTILRLKRAYDAAGGRNSRLPRAKAIDALKEATRATKELAERCLPPSADTIDFETFCAAVAELAADAENQSRNGQESEATGGELRSEPRVHEPAQRDVSSNGLWLVNPRLKAYGRKLGLFIPKNGGHRPAESSGGVAAGPAADSDAVFTPGTERRLQRLPAMLGAPTHDVYLGGTFPMHSSRPEDVLRREGFTYVVPRACDYTRMFSTPARRTAPAHPESPRRDKKPRPASTLDLPDDVQLRERSADTPDRHDRHDRLRTYDEDLLLGSRVLVFAMSADAPCFAAMVLAAHYMGLRPANTVLLVQPMDPQKAHNYSEVAVKDYNRGRHYLSDLAKRSGVPVFDNVDAAMACVISRLRATL